MPNEGTKPWLLTLAGLAVPGLGHLLQGRWVRALILGGAVLSLFGLGIWLGGNIFVISSSEEGTSYLLQYPPAFADLGNGIAYIFCAITGVGSSPDLAKLYTYEFGQRFILVSGLLNFLAALDCFDIAVKRKS
ncbi:MAG: DUF6677 family protein [Pyrinomonadaceae bacterium]